MGTLKLFLSRLLSQMAVFVILSLCINVILCYESSSSSELNRIEFTPLYETIIYSDIADIIKDYENAVNSPLETFVNNDDNSESDENIDDLLSEYQHYLDKAHKQRRTYAEKIKGKNKVPLLHRDRYTKSRAAQTNKHDDYYDVKYYNPSALPLTKPQFNTPLDFLIPINLMRSNLLNNYGQSPVDSTKQFPIDKISPDAKLLQLPPALPSPIREAIQSSCYCEADTFPCECGCKQCLTAVEPTARKKTDDTKLASTTPKTIVSETSYKNMPDNTINIRIKVDVQFPQAQQSFGEILKNKSNDKLTEHGNFSKESSIKLPFPFFNAPFPLEMFGFKKPSKDTAPIHKITIHRKKKSKASNGKRHRKKVITFHDLKLDHHSTEPSLDENYNVSNNLHKMDNYIQINQANATNNFTRMAEPEYTDISANRTETSTSVNGNQTDDNVYLMFNIRKSGDYTTEDVHKNENSIETEYTKVFSNISTEEPTLREKREVASPNHTTIEISGQNTSQVQNASIKTNDIIKKSYKSFVDDVELLYWPNNSKSHSIVNSTSIINLILDRENNKKKLNLSTDTIRHDRSRALEEAIFGKVDWNDVDTVAPVFLSFMGKYIRGVLSFCSDTVCHSMKCAEKICVHRTCAPADRTNNRGHCAGSDTTDSVASMESIMDLPSNIAFEIVDILQHKMLGKLFGKATLCIGSKCITFTASKKNFSKIKCTPKELDATGHCPITKSTKHV